MSGAAFLDLSAGVALVVMAAALILVAARIVLGPTLPDRVVALDLLVGIVIGLIAAVALKTGVYAYLDVAIALGLVGFLSTVAFARFILTRGRSGDAAPTLPDSDTGEDAR